MGFWLFGRLTFPGVGVAKERDPLQIIFTVLAVVITISWFGGIILDAIPGSSYDPPAIVHAAFMALTTGVISAVTLRKRGPDDDDHHS